MESGTRHNSTPPAESRFWRCAGFALLTGPALAVIGLLVLAPAWGRYSAARTDLERQRTRIADYRAAIAARRRFADAVRRDEEVLLKRLAMEQLGYLPANEYRFVPRAGGFRRTRLVRPVRHAPPPAPRGRLLNLARRLEAPPTRRGLFALTIAALCSAVLLFGPRRREPDAA